MLKLNFEGSMAAQDMIRIVMRDKGLSASGAINFSVNQDMYHKIIKEGYASIAYNLWGHDDPERKWDKLENPAFEVDLGKEKEKLVIDISKKENVDMETAVGYFLIFTMDFLGYHI